MERPLSAARIRSRGFMSSFRLRVMQLAKVTLCICQGIPFIQRSQCQQWHRVESIAGIAKGRSKHSDQTKIEM